ncbi:tetratricopeptide domain-containing protein : Tetratricopeptide repeat domain protein OS=uncultured planctomycete GN=HGMM_F16E03C28 PE=4 SV=1 [Gemmataceae bacterium]|nr:tetratricopeptide domain-containing protein : Tetratricopeptide repeat domain protein OS=uncultured planctomycete GN=HGMM_F16E03C28 PE=4 SV=1 [Gemmataceae bacterium]VTU01413.1 tetratricopeptide domain-containing protein : Tetratricopeptide repeat domain protein OS=uncultured planctomycete GN=HGMM_F16E03C28 PE=4 SV=1 [Gemmataceae bacterium]
MFRLTGCVASLLLVAPLALAKAPPVAVAPAPTPVVPKMPLTGLAPAKPMFDACVYRYGVGTANRECQAFLDQALGMYYSYVWIEAARAAETAVALDPECAYAWLVLHRSLEKWGKGAIAPKVGGFAAALGAAGLASLPDKMTKSPLDYSLEMARKLMPRAGHREQLLVQARLQEKGMWPNTGPDERKKKAQQTLDELLTLYEDDGEGWFWRAQIAAGDGPHARAPFYKAALKVNPLHPGANHELVHFFEEIRRPALGWSFAENYLKSSPGVPHAFHMQAHLATRIGKWGPTTDWSARAVELQIAYHKYQGVTPGEDHQFTHHMEILTRSLVHDGRFAEARELKAKAEAYKFNFKAEWFRMALAERDWAECQKQVDQFRKTDKAGGAYFAASACLARGETEQAGREIDTLRALQQSKKSDKSLERRLLEVQGRYLCQKGDGEAGLKLLKKLVDATKNDFGHHAWGNGAVYMEAWGVGALEAGNAEVAEEAFQEALAHDAGSVRGALGLWALCDRLGRADEAAGYLKVAQRLWSRATPKDFEALKADMARRATKVVRSMAETSATAAESEDAK